MTVHICVVMIIWGWCCDCQCVDAWNISVSKDDATYT